MVWVSITTPTAVRSTKLGRTPDKQIILEWPTAIMEAICREAARAVGCGVSCNGPKSQVDVQDSKQSNWMHAADSQSRSVKSATTAL